MVLYWENPTNEAFICCLLHFRTEVQSICHYPLGYLLCNSHQVTPNSFFFLDNVRFPFSPENPQFSHKQISNQKGLVNPVPVMGHVIPVCWFGVFCNYSNELVSFPLSRYHYLTFLILYVSSVVYTSVQSDLCQISSSVTSESFCSIIILTVMLL